MNERLPAQCMLGRLRFLKSNLVFEPPSMPIGFGSLRTWSGCVIRLHALMTCPNLRMDPCLFAAKFLTCSCTNAVLAVVRKVLGSLNSRTPQ